MPLATKLPTCLPSQSSWTTSLGDNSTRSTTSPCTEAPETYSSPTRTMATRKTFDLRRICRYKSIGGTRRAVSASIARSRVVVLSERPNTHAPDSHSHSHYRPGLARSGRDGPTERDRLLARRDQGVCGGYGVGRERSGSQASGYDVSRGLMSSILLEGAALQRGSPSLRFAGFILDC
jgi:hypothetical protein